MKAFFSVQTGAVFKNPIFLCVGFHSINLTRKYPAILYNSFTSVPSWWYGPKLVVLSTVYARTTTNSHTDTKLSAGCFQKDKEIFRYF
jgi:hypothetical protein